MDITLAAAFHATIRFSLIFNIGESRYCRRHYACWWHWYLLLRQPLLLIFAAAIAFTPPATPEMPLLIRRWSRHIDYMMTLLRCFPSAIIRHDIYADAATPHFLTWERDDWDGDAATPYITGCLSHCCFMAFIRDRSSHYFFLSVGIGIDEPPELLIFDDHCRRLRFPINIIGCRRRHCFLRRLPAMPSALRRLPPPPPPPRPDGHADRRWYEETAIKRDLFFMRYARSHASLRLLFTFTGDIATKRCLRHCHEIRLIIWDWGDAFSSLHYYASLTAIFLLFIIYIFIILPHI